MEIIHFSDPACPFAYSSRPALTVLRWRYGDQLSWRLVMIGLRDEPGPARPVASPSEWWFARYNMPYTAPRRPRGIATGRACRAIVATRLLAPGREYDVHRALQLSWFTTALMLDEDDGIAEALDGVDGLDVNAIIAALDSSEVAAAYAHDRDEARSAGGGAAQAQNRTATAEDGRVRYTAPSLIFEGQLEVGGFQPLQAYDVCIANLAPELQRRPPAADPVEALEAFPAGLVAASVAAILAERNTPADVAGTEATLVELEAQGRIERHGPLWRTGR